MELHVSSDIISPEGWVLIDAFPVIKLSTEEFVGKMGNPAFIRIDLNSGVMSGKKYTVDIPPEAHEGFFEAMAQEIVDGLKPEPRTSLADDLLFWLKNFFINKK